MKFFLLLLCLLSTQASAASFKVQAAEPWPPSPSPTVSMTPTESPTSTSTPPGKPRLVKGTATETATVTVTATPQPTLAPELRFHLIPLKDKRPKKQVASGRTPMDIVFIEAEGRTLLAKAWSQKPYGDVAYLFHRDLTRGLARSGFTVSAAEEPTDQPALDQALAAGARYAVEGEITRLSIVKRGVDALLGTNFNGTNYYFNFEATLRVWDTQGSTLVSASKVEHQIKYYNPAMLGSAARETYPHYFMRGLPETVDWIGGADALRRLAGLPLYTPTPTVTLTPERREPTPGATPIIIVVTPTPVPKASGAYWVCPKDSKEMDSKWEVCPWDGTPRSKFILKQR